MKKKTAPPEDPVVAEVRAIRRKIWKEAGGTFEGLQRYLDRVVPVAKPRRPKRVRPRP